MSGIYLHIPFCTSKCNYCGFYSIPSQKRMDVFLEALHQEIALRKDYLHGEPVETVYFGGGTPSLLKVEDLRNILGSLSEQFQLIPQAEITLEANPDTLSPDYLNALRTLGINRLSIGIQSFFDDDLKYLGRRHNATHARQCLLWAKEAGFENITVDLIYGLPTADAGQWEHDLDTFFELAIPHLSAYALTLEPNAILTKQIEMGKAVPVNEDDAVRDYAILCQKMAQHGFEHYEISNFCKPGWHSRHNTAYWNHIPYLGLGPSAHSFDGATRQWNVASVEEYCRSQKTGARGWEEETLTMEQRYDEYVMLRLRTMWGIDLEHIRQRFGEAYSDYCEKQAQPLMAQGRLSRKGQTFYLTDEQMLFADGIAETLFW